MLRTATLSLLTALFVLVGTADADVVVLRNGRKLEGEVTKKTATQIKLRLSWGVMTIPKSRIKSITQRASAKKEYQARLKKTDMKDAAAVTKLAEWAAKRGLGKEARQLGAQSLAMRLETRYAEARKRDTVDGWLSTYHWARRNGATYDDQLHAITKARALAPRGDQRVAVAVAHLRKDIAAEERRLRKIEEVSRRPHYAMMKDQTYVRRSEGLVPISGKVTLKSMMKPEANRKQLLQRLASYRQAAAALSDPRDRRTRSKPRPKARVTRVTKTKKR